MGGLSCQHRHQHHTGADTPSSNHPNMDNIPSIRSFICTIVQTLLLNHGFQCSSKTTAGSFSFHIHNTYINLHVGENNCKRLQVRHPFERLVSAYRHLFLHGGWRLLDHSWEGDTEREEVSWDWWSLVT